MGAAPSGFATLRFHLHLALERQKVALRIAKEHHPHIHMSESAHRVRLILKDYIAILESRISPQRRKAIWPVFKRRGNPNTSW